MEKNKDTPYRLKPISGQAKQVQRAIEYKGVMSKEELDRLTHQQVIDFREAYRYKIVPEERLSAFQSQLGKKIDSVAEMLDFNAVKYITEAKKKTISQDEIEKIHQKCIQDGKCKLCHKGCYDTPRDTHKMVHEQALCDKLFGESKLFRKASEGCRCKSQRAMRDYWGENVENFDHHLARQMVYEENRKILYKHGKSSFSMTFTITKENLPLFHLGAIQYDHTSGRYDNKKYTLDDVDMCQNMHVGVSGDCDMPEVPEDHGTWWPVHRVPSTGYSIMGLDH